jgi:antitoxin (DNA-binding transcriptional repressor) of toxin-antitoxin stability system
LDRGGLGVYSPRIACDRDLLVRRELGEDIVVVTERNRPVAAIVPLKHVDRESLALRTHPEFLDLIARARREFAAGKTPSFEEMKKRCPLWAWPTSGWSGR